jgi:hypothetical protein
MTVYDMIQAQESISWSWSEFLMEFTNQGLYVSLVVVLGHIFHGCSIGGFQ